MAKDKFCFVQTSPFGQSKEAQKLEQLRARAHAASVSPRRRRTSFQILHDVFGAPAQEENMSTAAHGGLPNSPQSLDGQSSETINQLWSASAISASSSAGPLSPPDTPEALTEGKHNLDEDEEELVKRNNPNAFRSSAAGPLVVPNRGAHPILSDYRCFRGMRTDPFDCIPARGSECVSDVVDYRAFNTAN